MRYLVIGGSGFIGSHIMRECARQGKSCLGTYRNHPCNGMVPFDLLADDPSDLADAFLSDTGDAGVIICSAETNMDKCYTDWQRSYLLNVEAVKRMADCFHAMGAKITFFSSEYVFDGKKALRGEKESPAPETAYGRQKLEAETYIRQEFPDALVFRVSKAVSADSEERDIIYDISRQLDEHQEVCCVKGQAFCPTEVDDIAQCVIAANEKGLTGIYHLSAEQNCITRYDLACRIARLKGCPANHIYEKTTKEIGLIDKRLILGGLSNERIKNDLGSEFMDLEDILFSKLRGKAHGRNGGNDNNEHDNSGYERIQ